MREFLSRRIALANAQTSGFKHSPFDLGKGGAGVLILSRRPGNTPRS